MSGPALWRVVVVEHVTRTYTVAAMSREAAEAHVAAQNAAVAEHRPPGARTGVGVVVAFDIERNAVSVDTTEHR